MVLGVLDGFGLEWGMSSLWKWKGKTNLAVQNWLNRLLWPWLLVVWLCGFAMLPRDSWNSPIHCITLCQSDPLTAPVSDLSVSRQRLKRSADRTPLMWAARHGHLNVAGPSGWFQLQHISTYLKQIIQWIWLGSKFTSLPASRAKMLVFWCFTSGSVRYPMFSKTFTVLGRRSSRLPRWNFCSDYVQISHIGTSKVCSPQLPNRQDNPNPFRVRILFVCILWLLFSQHRCQGLLHSTNVESTWRCVQLWLWYLPQTRGSMGSVGSGSIWWERMKDQSNERFSGIIITIGKWYDN